MLLKKKISLLIACIFMINLLFSIPEAGIKYPHSSCYYLNAFLENENSEFVPKLARYSLIILDMEMGEINPNALLNIKALNPDIRILAYMTSQEIVNIPNQTNQPLRYELYNGIHPSWWLKDSNGNPSVFWEGTSMLNCTDYCPVYNNQTWSGYFSNFISSHVLSNNLWDGFFVDNCWSNVPWSIINIDSDNNGSPDNREILDTHWKIGMNSMLNNLRNQYPNKILVGNGAYDYGQFLNGSMIEAYNYSQPDLEFGFDWVNLVKKYYSLENNFVEPNYHIINPMEVFDSSTPVYFPQNLKHMRFTLATALLGSAYYGLDLGSLDHSDTWWFDEYNTELGEPLTPLIDSFDHGQNEIINGDFNNGAQNWLITMAPGGYGNLSVTNENGNNYATCNINTAGEYDYCVGLSQINNAGMIFSNNGLYYLSFKAKANTPRAISFIILNHLNYDWVMTNLIQINLTNEWKTYTYLITPDNNIYNPSELRFSFQFGNQIGTVCFDEINLDQININLIIQRKFENGLVLCNPSDSNKNILLDENYYRINGTQDLLINNGQACDNVTLPSRDGLILIKNAPKIELSNGWNIFSLNTFPNNIDALNILSPLISNNTLIKVINESGQTVEYFDVLNQWINNIGSLTPTEAYYIKVNNDTQLVKAGNHTSFPLSIPLIQGWNLISYPYDYEYSAIPLLELLLNNNQLVKVMNESGQSIENLPGIGLINNINTLKPGEGYAIKVNQNTNLTYPNIQREMANQNTFSNLKKTNIYPKADKNISYFQKTWNGNGFKHCNFFILADDSFFNPGDEIAIFDGELCVANLTIEGNELYYGLIASLKEGEMNNGYTPGNSFTVRAYINQVNDILIPYEITYGAANFEPGATSVLLLHPVTADNNLTKPYKTEINSIYPNPFNPTTTINYSLNKAGFVKMDIYNIKGQKINTLVSEYLKAGNYLINWNGNDYNDKLVSSGIYFCKFKASDKLEIYKMLLIK